MKRLKALIALLLAFCLAAVCLAGCVQEEKTTEGSKESEKQAEEQAAEPKDDTQTVTGTFSDSLMLEQVGVVGRDDFYAYDGGLIYQDRETKKYGIISSDGLFDSGAIYTSADGKGAYFSVRTKKAANTGDIAGLNAAALVAGNGRQIVGPQYASYVIYGDFAIALKAVAKDEDGQLVIYSSSEAFEVENDSSVSYSCNWDVYSVSTGAKILEGTGSFSGYNVGPFLQYYNGQKYVYIDANGTAVLDGAADVFEDGSYAIEGQIGEVFDSNGTKLFAYDLTGHVPYEGNGEYYLARRYMDGKTTYVVMDKTGKIVSKEFEQTPMLKGKLILADGVLQDFQGKVLLEGTCKGVTVDNIFGKYYIARTDDVHTMLDENGTVYLSLEDDGDHALYSSEFVAYDKSSGDYMYFNHKTQKYDIKGSALTPWLVKVSGANYTYELVDTMTGSTLLSGYSSYTYSTCDSESYYIYAKFNGGANVYLATSTNGFKSVTDKKADLLDDLSTAFQAEGLTVTVNRQTGEIAMDASVLFGGDSAELTAEGKAFLDKFIKAYNSVAFSAKYENFISKTMIEGHTAPVAGSTYASGLSLSEERAANVKAYILSGETGVDLSAKADAFEDVGMSNSQPVYNEDGTVNMDASRRVSFRFLVNANSISAYRK